MRKKKSEEFPLAVKAGSAVVKIYKEQKASGTYYRVGYYLGGNRTWQHCDTLEKAKEEADAKAKQLSRGDVDAAQLTGRDRLVYGRALEALRPLDIALDAAAIEFADAKKILNGYRLDEAARYFMRHHGHGIKPKAVADAVAEMVKAKEDKGVSATYLADLRYRLNALAEAFHCNVNAIVPDDLRAYFDGLKLAPRGFNNMVATLRTFFAFANQIQNGGFFPITLPLADLQTPAASGSPSPRAAAESSANNSRPPPSSPRPTSDTRQTDAAPPTLP